MVGDIASYDGHSGFLRWWPKALLLAALWVLFEGGMRAAPWATFLVVVACVQSHYVPWRFTVLDDGLHLQFPFGRRVFLGKPTTTVRLETVGAVAMTAPHSRVGYVLHDGLLYVPDQRTRLLNALTILGYRVV